MNAQTTGLLVALAATLVPCATARTVNLAQAIQAAVDANAALKAQASTAQAAHAAVLESISKRYPRLNLEGSLETTDDPSSQLPDSNKAVVTIHGTVYDAGRLSADLARLRFLEDQTNFEVTQKKADIIASVKEAYDRILAADERISLYQDASAEWRQLLRLNTPRFAVGQIPEYDNIKIKLTLVQYQRQIREANREREHAVETLEAATGMSDIDKVAPLSQPVSPTSSTAAAELIKAALDIRADVKATSAAIAAQGQSVVMAQKERYPTVGISADVGFTGPTLQKVGRGWGLAATFAVPLYDFGELADKIAAAKAEQEAQRFQLEQLKTTIATDIKNLVTDLTLDWSLLNESREVQPEAERAFQNSLQRYRTGVAAMTELSDAHDLWVTARLDVANAVADYRIAEAKLEAAEGLTTEGSGGAKK